MKKRIVQATATALLFASMAGPAFAHGNGEDSQKNMFGVLRGKFNKSKHFDRFDRKAEKFAEKWELKGDIKSDSICKEDALLEQSTSFAAAQKIYTESVTKSRDAYFKALQVNFSASISARASALAALKSGGSSQAAWDVYVKAVAKINDDWHTADKTARETWNAARKVANTALKTAKDANQAEYNDDLEDCK